MVHLDIKNLGRIPMAQLMTATALTALALPVTTTVPHVNLNRARGGDDPRVFGTGITFYLNYRLLTDEGPTAAATVGYLLPVVSVTLGEPLSPRVVGGMVVGLTRLKPQLSSPAPSSC
jgi:hypothetical protein